MTHVLRPPQIDLSGILAQQIPHLDLKLSVYETSTRNFLKAVSQYKNNAISVITERKNAHTMERKRLSEKLQSIQSEANQCTFKEIELLADLEREQEERQASELGVASFTRQLSSLREKCASFDVELEQYRALSADLRREKEKELYTLRSYAASSSPELEACQRLLKCAMEGIEKDQLLVRFSHLEKTNPDRECSLVLDVSGQNYKVLTTTPALAILPILVDELNASRDIRAFMQEIRREFFVLVNSR